MKSKSLVALIVGLLCIGITVFGMFKAINGSVFKMPIVKLVADEAELEEINDELEDAIEELEDASDDEIEEFEEKEGISFKEAKAFIKTPSLGRFIKIADKADFGDEDVAVAFKIIRIFIIICALVVILFSALGVFLKKKVFPILAMVFSLGFYLVFVGVIWLILFIALSIVHMVLFSKENEAEAVK